MASSVPPGSSSAGPNPRKALGFMANAKKNKDSYIQLFAMTGILLMSMKSLGQKYHMHEIEEDTVALREEQQALTDRLNKIKRDLLHEASLEPTGRLAARLRHLFGKDS